MATLVNGEAYSWPNLQIRFLGRTVAGITAINYSDSQEVTMNTGAGIYPVSYSRGQYTAEGSITLEAKEVQAIIDSAPGETLQSINPFNIVIAIVGVDGLMATHTLCNCLFKTNGISASKGDTSIETEVELAIATIKWK